jgi:hypothetical protein
MEITPNKRKRGSGYAARLARIRHQQKLVDHYRQLYDKGKIDAKRFRAIAQSLMEDHLGYDYI